MKVSRKKSIFSLLELVFAVLLLVTSIAPKTVNAASGDKLKYFVIEKKWNNDLEEERPDSITINIEGSDSSFKTETLTKNEGWKKAISVPAYDTNGVEITYSIYESEPEKYQTSNGERNKLIVKSVVIDDLDGLDEVTTYEIDYSGIDLTPKGNVLISNNLLMSAAEIDMDESIYTYGSSYTIYGDVETYTNTYPRIIYTGNLTTGQNDLTGKDIVLTWKNKARNIYTNESYNLRITISNISIYSLVDVNNSEGLTKYIALLSNTGNKLNMEAYVGPNFDSSNLRANVVGVKADITIEVLNDAGETVSGFTQLDAVDLDQPDYYNMFKEHGNNELYSSYFGVSREFVESVKLEEGVVSKVYLDPNTYLESQIEGGDIKFASKQMPDSDLNKTSLKCLVQTEGFRYAWAGSNCGTAIIAEGDVPDPNDFYNSITNTSSFYQVRYFYQKDDGTYVDNDPEYFYVDKVIMIKPGTEISVNENADLEPKKEGYSLDLNNTNLEEVKKTSEENTLSAPQVLNVYFKKQYIVRYHDNVDNKVFAQQDNPELDYGVSTPGFDTDTEAADIQAGDPVRQGYEFLGWSEESDSEIIEVPATVTKNADYWAHWKPAINKYRVEYYYEVDGKYPSTADYSSADRSAYTEDLVSVNDNDKVPVRDYYKLNGDMDSEWKGVVLADGTLVLKVYFKQIPKPSTPSYTPPVTGVE